MQSIVCYLHRYIHGHSGNGTHLFFAGPSEDDCLSCTDGFLFDEKEKECVSRCPNGNYWSQDDQVRKTTGFTHPDVCLSLRSAISVKTIVSSVCIRVPTVVNAPIRCHWTAALINVYLAVQVMWTVTIVVNVHQPGTVIRSRDHWFYQEDLSGSLGFCLHPLVNASTHSSSWWLVSPLEKIRERFDDLDHSNQTIVLLLLVLSIVVMFVAVLLIGVFYFRVHLLFFKSPAKHEDVEYVMLEDLDEHETLTLEHWSILFMLISTVIVLFYFLINRVFHFHGINDYNETKNTEEFSVDISTDQSQSNEDDTCCLQLVRSSFFVVIVFFFESNAEQSLRWIDKVLWII